MTPAMAAGIMDKLWSLEGIANRIEASRHSRANAGHTGSERLMWQRRTFHECAQELGAISEDFRAAHVGKFGWDVSTRDRVKADTSQRGVEVLRILALSIRGDQDAGLTDSNGTDVVGALGEPDDAEIEAMMRDYRPPYSGLTGYRPMGLREALNKIAHASPMRGGFWADSESHDLILTGNKNGRNWVAVISLLDLCRVIATLPDAQISN